MAGIACSFCGHPNETGYGVTVYKRDGTMQKYCSRKCEKNTKMKRNPLKFKWTLKTVTKSTKPKTSKS